MDIRNLEGLSREGKGKHHGNESAFRQGVFWGFVGHLSDTTHGVRTWAILKAEIAFRSIMKMNFHRILLLLVLVSYAWSVERLAPGIHGPIDAGITHARYSVLVPQAASSGKPLPTLYLAGWGFIPKLEPWLAWAEREGVVVVSLFDFYGINPYNASLPIMDANRLSLEARVRVHPFLRVGLKSQRTAAAMMMMAKSPMSGIGMTIGFNTEINPRDWDILIGQPPHVQHVLVFDSARPALDSLVESWNNEATARKVAVSIETVPQLGAEIASVREQQRWSTFAFDHVLSSHPLLKKEELELGVKRLSQRVDELKQQTNVTQRSADCRLLASIPAMNKKHPDYKRFAELYVSSLLATPEEDAPFTRHVALATVSKDLIKALDKSLSNQLTSEQKRLLSVKAVKDEILAEQIFVTARSLIEGNKGNRTELIRQVGIVEKLVSEYPATIAGRRAATMLHEWRRLVR